VNEKYFSSLFSICLTTSNAKVFEIVLVFDGDFDFLPDDAIFRTARPLVRTGTV
jgi:hypothetical protein